jgi:ribosomal protein S16
LLTIRLARIGKKKRPFYRVIVTAAIDLNRERVDYWIAKGAQPSDTVRSFLRNRKPV